MANSSQYIIPEFDIELSDGSKLRAKCNFASLVAYEQMTGNSVLSMRLSSASEMVKFLACAVYGSEALEHLSELSEKLSPSHFKTIANLIKQFFPQSDEEEGDESSEAEEKKDSPEPKAKKE